jgi:hypothetical protein
VDPRRRAALERIRRQFKEAGGDKVSLVDELIAKRRLEATAHTDRLPLPGVWLRPARRDQPSGARTGVRRLEGQDRQAA